MNRRIGSVRLLALLSVAVLVAALAGAQVPCQLTEDFESGVFPPAEWTLASTGDSASPGIQDFTSGVTGSHCSPHGGAHGAWHNDDNLSSDAEDWLVMPQITVSGGAMTMTFWSAYYYTGYYNYHGVWVSTGSGDPADGDFVELQEVPHQSANNCGWSQVTVDLSAYQGQTIWLAFRYVGDWEDEWYIDDVVVDACGSGGSDADLSVTKTTTATGTVHPGDPVDFTIRVDNAGPADATNIVVTDVLPAELDYASCTGGCTYDAGTRTVTWNIAGPLTAGSYQEVTLSTTVADGASGTIENTASAAADETDPDGANNQSAVSITASNRIPGIPATTPAGTAAMLLLLAGAAAIILRRSA